MSSPASASGSTAVPPPAPSPMTTTSVAFSVTVAIVPSVSASAAPQRVVDGRLVRRDDADVELLLRLAVAELDAGEADQVPADEVGVPAVDGVPEQTLHGVLANEVEERTRARREPRGDVALHLVEDRVLLRRREVGEVVPEPRARVRVRRTDAGRVR